MREENLEKAELHLLKWFGKPQEVGKFRLKSLAQEIEFPYFSYQSEGKVILVTLGSSIFDIPKREKYFPEFKHVGFEYIVHCKESTKIINIGVYLLELVSSYPQITGYFGHFGSVIPLGTDLRILNSERQQYIFLMEPLLDDKDIYGKPQGQFEDNLSLVQFVWAIPIYDSEANFIANHGDEKFINLILNTETDMSDWQRKPIM